MAVGEHVECGGKGVMEDQPTARIEWRRMCFGGVRLFQLWELFDLQGRPAGTEWREVPGLDLTFAEERYL